MAIKAEVAEEGSAFAGLEDDRFFGDMDLFPAGSGFDPLLEQGDGRQLLFEDDELYPEVLEFLGEAGVVGVIMGDKEMGNGFG